MTDSAVTLKLDDEVEMLKLPNDVEGKIFTQSRRAGMEAFESAINYQNTAILTDGSIEPGDGA